MPSKFYVPVASLSIVGEPQGSNPKTPAIPGKTERHLPNANTTGKTSKQQNPLQTHSDINDYFVYDNPQQQDILANYTDPDWHKANCFGCDAFVKRWNQISQMDAYGKGHRDCFCEIYKFYIQSSQKLYISEMTRPKDSLVPRRAGLLRLKGEGLTHMGECYQGTSIRGANLHGATLKDTTIANSTLVDCQLTDCVVLSSFLQDSAIKDCTISENTTVCDSKLNTCHVVGSTVDLSFITDGKVEKCDLRYTTIDGHSSVKGTKMINCKRTEDLSHDENNHIVSFIFALRRFPVEIRQMIMKYAIGGNGWKWETKRGSMFLAAMRGDAKLYVEALKVMNEICAFRVKSKDTDLMLRHAHPSVLQNLQHLSIKIYFLTFFLDRKIAHDLNNIKTLHIECNDTKFKATDVVELLECLHLSRTKSPLYQLLISFMNVTDRSVPDPAVEDCERVLGKLLGDYEKEEEDARHITLLWKAEADGILRRKIDVVLAVEEKVPNLFCLWEERRTNE